MSRLKFRKLYFPGLISLVFLPLMCICYLISNNTFHRYRVMDVVWQSKESLNEWFKFSHEKINVETLRRYKQIYLTGNAIHDDPELKKVTVLIKQLINNLDTLNGIRISIGSYTQYAEIVEVLDDCSRNEVEGITGMPYNSEILIWFNKPFKQKGFPDIDKGGLNVVKNFEIVVCGVDKITTTYQRFISTCSKYFVSFWPALIVFILMLYFTFQKKKRYLMFHPLND